MTAPSWIVLNHETREILFGRLEKERREIASLTKIMTLYTALQLCDQLKIELSWPVVVTQEAAEVTGTSANLKPGDTLTIEQLMYGVMLPSGNDAAFLLASFFG